MLLLRVLYVPGGRVPQPRAAAAAVASGREPPQYVDLFGEPQDVYRNDPEPSGQEQDKVMIMMMVMMMTMMMMTTTTTTTPTPTATTTTTMMMMLMMMATEKKRRSGIVVGLQVMIPTGMVLTGLEVEEDTAGLESGMATPPGHRRSDGWRPAATNAEVQPRQLAWRPAATNTEVQPRQ